MDSYDLAIIGTGPAGYTASIYASRYKISHVLIGETPGGLAAEAHQVCNYPSEMNITGAALMERFRAQVEALGAPIIMARALSVIPEDAGFLVTTIEGQFRSRAVLLATGTRHRRLKLDEEKRLLGKGVSYCATCDAAFYRDRVAAVLGSGNSALTAALHLAGTAAKVYLINRKAEFKGEPAWKEQVSNNPKIEIIYGNTVKALKGEDKLKSVILENPYQGQEELLTDGLFLEIGTDPDDTFSAGLKLNTDSKGYIIVDAGQATSLPGVFAAGDITTASNGFRQIITACAEGAVAAESIFKYLNRK